MLPHIAFEKKFTIKGAAEQLALNCNSTRLGVIDREGILVIMDIERDGNILGNEKKDIWAMQWSNDNPTLSAHMEKNRLYIVRDLANEEPVLSGAYLCDFADLEIKVQYI
jgi:WD repeat-containing protein 35